MCLTVTAQSRISRLHTTHYLRVCHSRQARRGREFCAISRVSGGSENRSGRRREGGTSGAKGGSASPSPGLFPLRPPGGAPGPRVAVAQGGGRGKPSRARRLGNGGCGGSRGVCGPGPRAGCECYLWVHCSASAPGSRPGEVGRLAGPLARPLTPSSLTLKALHLRPTPTSPGACSEPKWAWGRALLASSTKSCSWTVGNRQEGFS